MLVVRCYHVWTLHPDGGARGGRRPRSGRTYRARRRRAGTRRRRRDRRHGRHRVRRRDRRLVGRPQSHQVWNDFYLFNLFTI